ncbi:MAG: hypothetical protein ACTHXJ_06065, partial [Mesonia sp.]
MKNKSADLPFKIKVSFQKVVEACKKRYKEEDRKLAKKYLKDLLDYVKEFPELDKGIENFEDINKYDEPIQILLDDLFPNILTNNEIKAATIPKYDIILNQTNRFKEILADAGKDFEFKIRNYDIEFEYVRGCLLILKNYYGYDFDFSRPLYYDIPQKDGIIKNYRLGVNADFASFEKTDKAVDVSEEDVDILIQNTDDIVLWKEKFPPESWVFKGFILLNLTDVTVDDGISDLKTELLTNNIPDGKNISGMLEIFRSIYRIPDLELGFTMFDENLNASSEQKIINFIYKELNPLIEHLEIKSPSLKDNVDRYKKDLDLKTGVVYNHRKNYDDTVQRINRTLSRFLDRKQEDAQKIYPHYFERYKTDGVEHNMYIGSDMVKDRSFSEVYLYNLRLWQLQVMCEMENKFYNVQESMPLKLDAAS